MGQIGRSAGCAMAWLLGLASPCPGLAAAPAGPPDPIEIVAPASGDPLRSPSVEVVARLTPPLASSERVTARLLTGIDAVEGEVAVRELSDRIASSCAGKRLRVRVDELPPGRSTLELRRVGGDEKPLGFAVALLLDRGGFARTGRLFQAGVRAEVLVRTSSVDPTSDRVLDLLVWYPTDAADPPDPGLGAVVDAPVASAARELPALVYSHGNCGSADDFTSLASALARAGMLVASVSHTGNTRADPDCGELASQVFSLFERPDDVAAVVDWLEALSGAAGPLVDATRIGLGGHSFGGQTTLVTARIDDRLRAALALAPPAQLTLSSLPLAVPAMIQGASLDATTPFPEQQALYARLLPPRLLVELLGAGHSAFTDAAPETTRARVVQYALGFVGTYLVGDARWNALLAPVEGAVLRAERAALPRRAACSNGLDDDGDGLVDAGADPGCEEPESSTELPRHDLRIELPAHRLHRGGTLPVVLLGHAGLDLASIDPGSLAFGQRGARRLHAAGPHGAGPRRVVHFRAAEAGIAPGARRACLRGELAGEPFVACAALNPKAARDRAER